MSSLQFSITVEQEIQKIDWVAFVEFSLIARKITVVVLVMLTFINSGADIPKFITSLTNV